MENRDKIRAMSDEQLADFLKEVSKNYLIQYYDMWRWLRQETYDPVYIGEKGWYLKGKEEADIAAIKHEKPPDKNFVIPCKILESRKSFGEEYKRIIVGNELMDVPAKYVNYHRP